MKTEICSHKVKKNTKAIAKIIDQLRKDVREASKEHEKMRREATPSWFRTYKS
jgi:hypothetical protein